MHYSYISTNEKKGLRKITSSNADWNKKKALTTAEASKIHHPKKNICVYMHKLTWKSQDGNAV